MEIAYHSRESSRLWLHLVGPMQVQDGSGNSLLPQTRKARAVLAILAISAPRAVSRTRISELLWSRRERDQARGSLRQCLNEIQKLLQPLGPGVLEADREKLRLTSEAVCVNLRVSGANRPGMLLEDLGGLDPAFDAWLEIERERWAEREPLASLPRGVRVGVKALRVLGSEEEDVTLAYGLGEAITAALSRFRWISCLAHWTPGDSSAPGYLLDGTVQRAGKHVRVGLRMQDMQADGEVVWAQNFDKGLADFLSLQDTIGEQAAAQIDAELLLREGARAATRLTGLPTSYDLTLGAVPGLLRLDRDGFNHAGKMLAEATQLAPGNAAAHAWFAYWHVLAVGQGWEVDAGEAMKRAAALAEHAVMLDSSDARSLTIAGHVRGFLDKQLDEAMALHERALSLNPALPLAWMLSGLTHCYLGQHAEACRRMEIARRLSPRDPHTFFFNTALLFPNLMLGEYERAAELGRLTTQLKPNFSSSWKGLLAALGYLGQIAEIAEVRAKLLALEPGFSVWEAMKRSPLRRREDRACYAEGLRRGGLAE